MSERGSRGAGIAAVVLAVTGFSWGFIFVKAIGLPPPVIAFWRLLIGAVTLSTIAVAWRVPWPRQWRDIVFAGLAFGVHQLLFITATKWTSVAIVTAVGASQPLLVALASRRTVGERVPPIVYGCAVAALAGVATVLFASTGNTFHRWEGDALAVVNVVAVTAYFLLAKRARMDGAPTLTFTASFTSIALVVVAPAAVFVGVSPPAEADLGWLALLALGSGNCHLLLNWAHPRVPAALSALILAVLPILSTVWAHLVLDEALTVQHAVGLFLVVGAIEVGRRQTA